MQKYIDGFIKTQLHTEDSAKQVKSSDQSLEQKKGKGNPTGDEGLLDQWRKQAVSSLQKMTKGKMPELTEMEASTWISELVELFSHLVVTKCRTFVELVAGGD